MKRLKMCLLIFSLLPVSAFAALGDNALVENTTADDLPSFLISIQNWLLGIVGGLTVLFIVYGGFLYVTSGGNKERTELGKKTLTYAILGLVIVVLAGLILNIISGNFLTSIFGNKSL